MAKSIPPHLRRFRSPGVYVEEISLAPMTISPVETAIPAFIGYSHLTGEKARVDLMGVPKRISSMREYTTFFGTAGKEQGLSLEINSSNANAMQARLANPKAGLLFYSLQAFFANGGRSCFVISVGNSAQAPKLQDYQNGLAASKKEERITLLCFPDAVGLLEEKDYYQLMGEAMLQCSQMRSRFLLVDLHKQAADNLQSLAQFRNGLSQSEGRSFAAAYYPYIISQLNYTFEPEDVEVHLLDSKARQKTISLAALKSQDERLFRNGIAEIRKTLRPVLPPSPYVAGAYALVDGQRGVWKAPANVSLQGIQVLTANINNLEQEQFNVDQVEGKSVNAIREFSGRGFLVWGARTLAGNDNEWRYVPVRRFVIMVESSLKEPLERMAFENNDADTWTKTRSMTENFLHELWRNGAIQGTKPDQAYFVRCGLGQTMTQQDINEGRMILELGLAAVRPAEFVILRITQKMNQA